MQGWGKHSSYSDSISVQNIHMRRGVVQQGRKKEAGTSVRKKRGAKGQRGRPERKFNPLRGIVGKLDYDWEKRNHR